MIKDLTTLHNSTSSDRDKILKSLGGFQSYMSRLQTYIDVKEMAADSLIPVENDLEFECPETPLVMTD